MTNVRRDTTLHVPVSVGDDARGGIARAGTVRG
jgi:hypothetical protein